MRAPSVHSPALAEIVIDRADTPFHPGDLLRGSCMVHDPKGNEVRSAELSVVWYTAGKGEEDLGVHYFQRFATEGPDAIDLGRRREFRTLLPEAPLSYDGLIVKICWCARLRLFLARGRQHVVEACFQLGEVASPLPVGTDDQQPSAAQE